MRVVFVLEPAANMFKPLVFNHGTAESLLENDFPCGCGA